MRHLFWAALCLGLIGCEGDGAKLTRLGAKQAGACTEAEVARQHIGLSDPSSDTTGWRRFGEAQTRCALATRDMNRFMGR